MYVAMGYVAASLAHERARYAIDRSLEQTDAQLRQDARPLVATGSLDVEWSHIVGTLLDGA
jgi:hypothetical protein